MFSSQAQPQQGFYLGAQPSLFQQAPQQSLFGGSGGFGSAGGGLGSGGFGTIGGGNTYSFSGTSSCPNSPGRPGRPPGFVASTGPRAYGGERRAYGGGRPKATAKSTAVPRMLSENKLVDNSGGLGSRTTPTSSKASGGRRTSSRVSSVRAPSRLGASKYSADFDGLHLLLEAGEGEGNTVDLLKLNPARAQQGRESGGDREASNPPVAVVLVDDHDGGNVADE